MSVFILAVLSMLLLTASEGRDSYTGTLILDGEHRIARGETVDGELVILGGQVSLAETARVAGSIYILSGNVEVNGHVGGDIALLGGRLALGPGSRIEGRISPGGGDLIRAPEAVVEGGVDAGSGMALPTTPQSPESAAWMPIISALGFALFAWLAVRAAPSTVFCIADAIREYPVVCAAMGVLAGLVGLVLMVSMVFTVVLIPVAFLTGLTLVLAVALGWIGAGALVGRYLGARLRHLIGQPMAALIGMLLFIAFLTLMNQLPGLSGIGMLVVAAIALGAVLLTRFGSRRFVSASEDWKAEADLAQPA